MEYRPHPTHHRAFVVALRLATVVGLVVFIADLFVLRDYNKAILTTAIAFILIVAAFLFWASRYTRSAVCPDCGAALPKEPAGPRGENHYRCDACQIVWVSEIRSGGG